jgi:hypothetical protein
MEDAGVYRGRDAKRVAAARGQGARKRRRLAMSHITRPRIKSERIKDVVAFLVALALTLFIKFA